MFTVKKAFLINFILLLVIIFCVSNAFADDYEYITHGGYDAAVEAWRRVSLLFGRSNFISLFATAFIAGFLFLFIGTLLRTAFGMKISPHIYLPYLIIGGFAYLALIVPKDRLIIYDETLNRGPITIDNVPRILAFTAGNLNKIERGILELIGTTSSPVENYRYNPAGLSINALGSLNGKQVPGYVYQSIYNFVKDCMTIALTQDPPAFTFEDINTGRVSFTQAISLSNYPGMYVTIYNSSGSPQTVECQQAVNTITSYVNSYTTFDNVFRAGCSRAGYDVGSAASYNQCKSMITNAQNFLLNKAGLLSGSSSDIYIAQQLLFANVIQDYVLANGPVAVGSYLATQKTTGSFIGLGMHANSWIPEMKEALTALVIALSPLLLIFVVTPLGGKAIGILVGFFIWLTVWGIVDALIHSFGLSMAGNVAKYLNAGGLNAGFGIHAASVIPNVTAKIYAIYGALRWSGLALASVLAAMLVRFGGAALTMVASQIARAPMGSGAILGEKMSTNPMQTVTESYIPMQTMANVGYALGGMRNFLSAYAGHYYRQYAEQAASGLGWNLTRAAMTGGLGGAILGLSGKSAYDISKAISFGQNISGNPVLFGFTKGEQEAIKETGDVESYKKFMQQPIVQAILSKGLATRDDVALLYKETGGNLGKLAKMAAGLSVLHNEALKPEGKGFLNEREKEIMLKGPFKEKLALLEKVMEMKNFQVQEFLDEKGQVKEMLYGFNGAGGSHIYYSAKVNPKTGLLEVKETPYDVKFTKGQEITTKDAEEIIERKMKKEEKNISQALQKLQQKSEKTAIEKAIIDTYTKERGKQVEKKITELLSSDKDFIDLLSAAKETAQDFSIGFKKFGTGYIYQLAAKAGHSKQYAEKLSEKLQQAISSAEFEATKNTFQNLSRQGWAREELLSFARSHGLSSVETLVKGMDLINRADVQYQKNLNAEFLEWYAKKYDLDPTQAWIKINEEGIKKEDKEAFLKEKLTNTDFSEKKERFNEGAKNFDKKYEQKEEELNKAVEEKKPTSDTSDTSKPKTKPKITGSGKRHHIEQRQRQSSESELAKEAQRIEQRAKKELPTGETLKEKKEEVKNEQRFRKKPFGGIFRDPPKKKAKKGKEEQDPEKSEYKYNTYD